MRPLGSRGLSSLREAISLAINILNSSRSNPDMKGGPIYTNNIKAILLISIKLLVKIGEDTQELLIVLIQFPHLSITSGQYSLKPTVGRTYTPCKPCCLFYNRGPRKQDKGKGSGIRSKGVLVNDWYNKKGEDRESY